MAESRGKNGSRALQRNKTLPLNIIRSETVLSKLPIHNLAKTGDVNIEIKKKNEYGEVELIWEISYSNRYGQARQMAYKLDTIFINRRIEEVGKPLPRIIRLGSLRDICKALDLEGSGDSINRIKKALRQNAFTGITAKFTYRGKDGSEQEVDASDTRYGVVFTGERLPNGQKADGVYIILHDFYLEILNNAPVRPLDYDYLKNLTPAAQRFYEVISYRIYAALKYKHPHAKITYSDYCTFSAQHRYYDYDHFKKQMYKVHRPHMQSGYICKTRYEETTDGDGNIDWTMYYIPGEKAKSEYITFTRKGQVSEALLVVPETREVEGRTTPPSDTGDSPARAQEPLGEEIEANLTEELTKRGITKAKAKKIISSCLPGQPILDQLEWGDHLISKAPKGKYENPPGFYVYLVQNNVFVPSNFETRRRQQAQEKIYEAEKAQRLLQSQLEAEYSNYVEAELDRYVENGLDKSERQQLFAAKKQELAKQYPYITSWSEDQLRSILSSAVRSVIYDRVTLLSYEEFCNEHSKNKAEPRR
jgi:hypothetical protein